MGISCVDMGCFSRPVYMASDGEFLKRLCYTSPNRSANEVISVDKGEKLMPQEDAYPKVQRILAKDRRLALLIEKEPRFLQLLHVAASQYKETVITGRWNSHEALKKTYKEILKTSEKKELSPEEYEVLITGLDELLPVANVREILQLEFAEPLYDEYGEEF